MEDAAATVGVSSVTVYARVRSDASFAAQYALSREYNTDVLEDRLHRMASGNVAALFGTLKARRPHRWRDNVKVEVQHTTGAEALREARRRVAEGDRQAATVAQPQHPGQSDAPTQH